jgi:hypothetical protein
LLSLEKDNITGKEQDIMKIQSKGMVAILVLLALNLCFSGFLAIRLFVPEAAAKSPLGLSPAEQTYLFVGTHDKDTHRAEIPFEQAKATATAVLAEHGITDFTTWDAHGGWMGPDNIAIYEGTIVYILYTREEAVIQPIVEDLCARLNQSSVSVFQPEGEAGLYFAQE